VTDSPDLRRPLDPERLAAASPWHIELLPSTPSTNAVAAERARAGAAEGTVVVTEHQTAGRGRLDRTWETPARSALTLSVVLRPPAEVPASRWPWLPLATGLAVARTLRADPVGVEAGVKWPNDVLVEDRKLCGILVERVETGLGPAAVVGIGLNTSLTREELPTGTATSLLVERGAPVDRTDVLLALLAEFDAGHALWREAPDELAAAYRDASVTLGRLVRAELPGGRDLVGTATRIDDDGRVVIEHAAGETPVGAGDVVHLRPA